MITSQSNTNGRLILCKHKETGEEIVLNTYLSRYRRLSMGFLNKLKMKPRFLKHITLTQRVEAYKPNILNSFFDNMRKYYGDVEYFWTVEVQEERFEKYGDVVLHWHVMFGFDYDIEFGREDVLRIQRYWKYGNADIAPVPRPTVSYLMKYVSKALGSPLESEYKIRRLGSSRIEGYLRQAWNKLVMAITDLMQFGVSPDEFSSFRWCRKGAFIEADEDEKRYLTAAGDVRSFKKRIYVFTFPPSLWYKVADCSYGDFSEIF